MRFKQRSKFYSYLHKQTTFVYEVFLLFLFCFTFSLVFCWFGVCWSNEKSDFNFSGILLFEIFHRKPPYNTRSMDELEKMINTKPLLINNDIDPRVQKLLLKILKKNSWERLSCQEILQDPDFKSLLDQLNISYPKMRSRPIKPKLIR